MKESTFIHLSKNPYKIKNMPQKTLGSYFGTTNRKSKRASLDNEEDENTLKKTKTGKENFNSIVSDSLEITKTATDQQNSDEEMNKCKILTEIKLQCQKTSALHKSIGIGWYEALKNEFSKEYFSKLSSFLTTARNKAKIFPPEQHVYSWSRYCDIKDVKVVILGQDPYHGPEQAHGLCFSVQPGVLCPQSLVNMYKELLTDIPNFKNPGHGYLTGWAKQGVLLLNACLTVEASKANSHKDQGWEEFTDAVIEAVSTHNKGVVFLLWGSYAQKKALIVDENVHHLLHAPHPSPLSAHRGFFGCKHFSKCNELLKSDGKVEVDWSKLSVEE